MDVNYEGTSREWVMGGKEFDMILVREGKYEAWE
jgi:hypothetical protein